MDQEDLKWLEEKKVDVSDMIAWLFTRWKPILIFGLLGLIISLLICFSVPGNMLKEEAPPPPKTLEDLRGSLSDAEALEVDNAFNDYLIFQNYNKELSDFSSVFLNTKESGGIIMVAKYYIMSSLKYCNSFYTDIAISSADYKKIYKIAYPGANEGEDITAGKNCPFQLLSENDPVSDGLLITAYIKADTEEQCKGILDVISSAFEKETQQLKKTDNKIACRCVDTGVISDQKNFYDNAEKMVVERIHVVNKAISTLNRTQVDKFSDAQKEYYNALKAGQMAARQNESAADATAAEKSTAAQPAASEDSSDDDQKTILAISPLTFIKYTGLGLLLGLFIAADFFILVYIFNGTVNSYKELGQFGIQTLETLFYDKGKGLIIRIGRYVREIQPTNVKKQLEMLSADLSIRMKAADAEKLYILLTSRNAMDIEAAERIKSLVEKDGITAIIGNPLESAETLKVLADTDRVVMLTHMKRSKKSTIVKVGAACQRFSKEIFGFIALEEC